MSFQSTATIRIVLNVEGNTDVARKAIEAFSKQLDQIGRTQTAQAAIDALNTKIKELEDRVKTSETALKQLQAGQSGVSDAMDKTAASTNKVADSTKKSEQAILAQSAATKASTTSWMANQEAVKRANNSVEPLLNRLNQLNRTFMESARGRRFETLRDELVKLQQAGKGIPVERLKEYQRAVEEAEKAHRSWGDEMKTLSGRMTFYQQQVDAIARASYRLKAVGADLTRISRGIFGAIKNVMDEFGSFDYALRRAAGAVEIFTGDTINGKNALDLLAEGAIRAGKEAKLIPLDEVAKGFYFWGSMTGVVINNMSDLNELVEGHSAILKVASMTEVGFEQALKGVYSVITQFYGGALEYTTEVTEKMFYITQKTAAEFMDLVQSFKMVGPVAKSLGVTFDDVVVVLGRLSDLGIRGTMAGRAIRQIFIQLVKPSVQAKEALNETFRTARQFDDSLRGFGSYYEAVFPEGEYVGIQKHLEILARMTAKMDTDTRSALLARISTANSLPILLALVADKTRELTSGIQSNTKLQLEQAHDYFTQTWQLIQDSWRAVVGGLERSWEALKITIGAGFSQVLKPVIETLEDVVDRIREWISQNPMLIRQIATFATYLGVFTGVAGAIATATGALLGFYAAARFAIGSFGPLVGTAARVLGVFTALIEAVIRNFDEIRTIIAPAIGDLQRSLGTFESAGRDAANALNQILEPARLVFDIIVKTTAWLIAATLRVIAFANSIGFLKPILEAAFAALGVLFAVKTLTGILSLVGAFKAVSIGVGTATSAMVGMRFALLAITAAMKGQITVAGLLRVALMGIQAIPIVAVATAIAGIGLALYATNSDVRDFADGFLKAFRDVRGAVEQTRSELGDLGDEFVTMMNNMGKNLAGSLNMEDMTWGEQLGFMIHETFTIAVNPDMWNRMGKDLRRQMLDSWNASNISEELMTALDTITQHVNDMFIQAGDKRRRSVDQTAAVMVFIQSILPVDTTAQDIEALARRAMATSAFADEDMWNRLFYEVVVPEMDKGLAKGMTPAEYDRLIESYRTGWSQLLDKLTSDDLTQNLEAQMENTRAQSRDVVQAIQTAVMDELSTYEGTPVYFEKLREILNRTFDFKEWGGERILAEAISDPMYYEPFRAWGRTLMENAVQTFGEGFESTGAQVKNRSVEWAKSITAALDDAIYHAFQDLGGQLIWGGGDVIAPLLENLAPLISENQWEEVIQKLFRDDLPDGRKVYDLMSDNTLPEDIRKALLAVYERVAEKYPQYADIVAAMKPAEVKDNTEEAVESLFKGVTESFMSAVSSGIKKSWKEIESGLRKRLNSGKTDTQRIGQLVNQLVYSDVIKAAMQQTYDITLQTDAIKAYTERFDAIIGGIGAHLERGTDTSKMKKDFQRQMEDLLSLPDFIVDPIIAQNADVIGTIYHGLNIPIPQRVLDQMSTEVKTGLGVAVQTGVDNVEVHPQHITDEINTSVKSAIENVDKPQLPGDFWKSLHPQHLQPGEGGGGMPSPASIAAPIIDVHTQALNKVAQDVGPVATLTGNKIITDLVNGVSSAVSNSATSIRLFAQSVVTNFTNEIASFGEAPAIRAGVALMDDFRHGLSERFAEARAEGTNAANQVTQGLASPAARVAASSGGFNLAMSWVNGLSRGFGEAERRARSTAAALRRILHGQSPPKEGPLKNIDKGGYNTAMAWVKGVSKGLQNAPKVAIKKAKELLAAISHFKNHPGWGSSAAMDRHLARELKAAKQAAIRFWEKHRQGWQKAKEEVDKKGSGDTTKKTKKAAEDTAKKAKKAAEDTAALTKRQIEKMISRIQGNVKGWKNKITSIRNQITDLLRGGLTGEEKLRKTYLESIIGDYEWRINKALKRIGILQGKLKKAPAPKKTTTKKTKGGKTVVGDVDEDIIGPVLDSLTNVKEAKAAGTKLIQAWADGFSDAIKYAVKKATDVAAAVKKVLFGKSPPIAGPLRDIDKGGFNVGQAWGESLGEGAVQSVERAVGRARAALVASSRTGFGGVEVSSSNRRQIDINIDVTSKDGSVDRVAQGELRRGLMDALVLADLEHMVTVT